MVSAASSDSRDLSDFFGKGRINRSGNIVEGVSGDDKYDPSVDQWSTKHILDCILRFSSLSVSRPRHTKHTVRHFDPTSVAIEQLRTSMLPTSGRLGVSLLQRVELEIVSPGSTQS